LIFTYPHNLKKHRQYGHSVAIIYCFFKSQIFGVPMDNVHLQIKSTAVEHMFRSLALRGSPMEMNGLSLVAILQQTSCNIGSHAIDSCRNLKFNYKQNGLACKFGEEWSLQIPVCPLFVTVTRSSKYSSYTPNTSVGKLRGITLRLLIAIGD